MILQDTDPMPVEARVFAELRALRSKVTGVCGSLVATSDGLLVAHDIPGMEPTRVAALVATTLGLAGQTTQATGRGPFREAVARGESGYLAVYAAGSTAVVAVVGENEMNIGMLHYEARDMIQRVAVCAAEFTRWAGPQAAEPTPGQPEFTDWAGPHETEPAPGRTEFTDWADSHETEPAPGRTEFTPWAGPHETQWAGPRETGSAPGQLGDR